MFPKTRQAILAATFLEPQRWWYMRELAREHKRKFAERLNELAGSRQVRFITEEAEPGIITWASRLGAKWENIDRQPAEREGREIPQNYAGNTNCSPEQRARWNAERERYMFGQIQRLVGDAQSLVVICGSEHRSPLADLLSRTGHSVSCEDVTQSDWFDSFVSQFV